MEAEPTRAKCPKAVNACLKHSSIDPRNNFQFIQMGAVTLKWVSRVLIALSLLSFSSHRVAAQSNLRFEPGVKVSPQNSEGVPISSVLIIIEADGLEMKADSVEMASFYSHFNLKPGSLFRQYIADLALSAIKSQPEIKSAIYEVFNSDPGGPVTVIYYVTFLKPDEKKDIEEKNGMAVTKSVKSFPVILETKRSKYTFLLNGGTGIFNEINPFFSKGDEFTQGNLVADNPAGKGERFWGEAYIEPGIAGISQIGKSKLYGYGAISALISGRNSSDIFSKGPTIFIDFERLYAGILAPGIGKKKQANIDLSAGRQFFQLNDGFLISRINGSANAGKRGSVYLSSRTAFEKTALLKVQVKDFSLGAFFLEPEELFKDKQLNTNYTGGSFMYNNNKWLDAGLSFISASGGKASYLTPEGRIRKKGMYVINPKLWLTDIAETGVFVKTEYAYQSHFKEDMQAQAWYVGIGVQKQKWRGKPYIYYRYAFMSGDDSTSNRYERYDPILSGGLGNWLQGLNYRKVLGNGNLISHRIEVKSYINKKVELSFDYFLLRAHRELNLGGLAPIARLIEKDYGHEVTLSGRYFINNHFLLLCVFSYAHPGEAIRKQFSTPVYDFTSVQASLFMFF
jgi:hypothetical protein